MVAVQAGKVRQFINKPDTNTRAILIYGPDAGMVREHASTLSKYFSKSGTEEGEIVLVDDSDSSHAPDRLAVELQMVPMFGGMKVIRFRPAARTNPKLVEELITDKNLPSYLIVEAGDLKKTAKIRQIFEKSKHAYALPCYADDARGVTQIIDEELSKANVTMAPPVKQYLASLLGADRGVSRTEIQKLLLYVQGKPSIEIEDIEAIIGDSSALSLDTIVFATTGGNLKVALANLDKAIASGNASAAILAALNRHFARLHKARVEVDKGEKPDNVVKRLRPPLIFKMQDEFKRQLYRWSERQILQAMDLIQQTTLRTRTKGNLDVVFVERLIMSLSQMAKK